MAENKIHGSAMHPLRPAKPKAAPAKPDGASPKSDAPAEYTVQKGDTLWSLSQRLNVSVSKLLELNPQLTHGVDRDGNGDRIYVGDKIKFQSESDLLKQQVEKAKEELAKAQQEAQAEQKASQVAQDVAGAKIFLLSMPSPTAWKSQEDATKTMSTAKEALAKIPADDPERADLEKRVADQQTSYKGIEDKLTKLTGDSPSLLRIEGRIDFFDEIRGLSPAAVAIATPDQKAKLIAHLTDSSPDSDNASKILEILKDAKRQGQLEATLGAMDKLTESTLFGKESHYMEGALPQTFPGGRFGDSKDMLSELQNLLQGTTHKGFLNAIKAEQEQRATQSFG